MPAQLTPVLMSRRGHTPLADSRAKACQAVRAAGGRRLDVQQWLRRACRPGLFGRPIVITNAEFRFIVAEQLRRSAAWRLISCSSRRGATPDLGGVAATLVHDRDPLARSSCSRRPLIRKPEEFLSALSQWRNARRRPYRHLSAFVRPGRPRATGYIRPAES